MLGALSKIKEVAFNAYNSGAGISINASLPLSFKVLRKTGFNKFELSLGRKNLRTKSAKALEIGAQYWGEASGGSDSILIQNMLKKPNFNVILENGLSLADGIVQNGASWFLKQIQDGLSSVKNASDFHAYSQMLLALSEGVAHVEFVRNGRAGLIQLSKSELYVIFDEIGPVKFSINENLVAYSPFISVVNLLNKNGIASVQVPNLPLLWQPKSGLMDGVA